MRSAPGSGYLAAVVYAFQLLAAVALAQLLTQTPRRALLQPWSTVLWALALAIYTSAASLVCFWLLRSEDLQRAAVGRVSQQRRNASHAAGLHVFAGGLTLLRAVLSLACQLHAQHGHADLGIAASRLIVSPNSLRAGLVAQAILLFALYLVSATPYYPLVRAPGSAQRKL